MKAWLSPWPFFCFVGVVLARRPWARPLSIVV